MTAKQGATGPSGPVPLSELMPWSVAPLRLGREWVLAPDAASLRSRWDALARADDGAAQERLFRPSRARTLHSAVAQLPGQATPTGRLARAAGPCPEPVRVLYGGYDQQWLLPDHRLIDAARPELWRVADGHQVFAVEQGHTPQAPGPALVFSALLPAGGPPPVTGAARPGRIRPLYRRPGGQEPNLAPGLTELLARRLGRPVDAGEVLAWIAATARHAPPGCAVPLTADPQAWVSGVELGRRLLWLHTRGAHDGERPRLPGGRRPYVRAALPARAAPEDLSYEPEEAALLIGAGRISPVPPGAWDFHAGGVRVLRSWFERRTEPAGADTLEALRPASWPQEWTSELLELITVLALLAELAPEQEQLARRVANAPAIGADALREGGVLPAPEHARRPASVLDHHEEGPEGQFALL